MSQALKIRLAVCFACSAIVVGSSAFGQAGNGPTVAPSDAPMTPTPPGSVPAAPAVAKSEAPVPSTESAAPRPLLMQGFDAIGLGKALDDAHARSAASPRARTRSARAAAERHHHRPGVRHRSR